MKNRPSSHLLLLLLLLLLNMVGYLAVWRAGVLRGFSPSLLLALRDLLLFAPVLFVFMWLARRHKYRGDLAIFTLAILLFSIGQVAQFRLFTDPEYSARQKTEARQDKTNTLRQRFVNDNYDADKKRAMFGSPTYKIPVDAEQQEQSYWTVWRLLTTSSSFIPLMALAGFCIAFTLLRRDDVLLLLQRHSFLLGLVTTIPFAVIAAFFSSGGKFLGLTTPWEPVKVTFLLSYAGILADQYRHLSRTYWGIPSPRFLLPFLLIALLPVIPFFLLSDFGQMLVFFGAYLSLYVVAVRRLPQVTMAIVLLGAIFVSSLLVAGAYNTVVDVFTSQDSQVSAMARVGNIVSQGVPRRVHQRFYLWLNAGKPPDPDENWWWAREAERAEGQGLSNEEAWYNSYAFQPSQALFGVSDGRVLGEGLGRGYPEIVPIADSDFIYAAVAEETGLYGGAIIIAAFVLMLVAGMRVAIESRDMYTKLLAAGITAFLGFQAVVNIGGVVRMLPMTGITLPFVSHGGWSLITCFVMIGMLMAISDRNQRAAAAG
ncbi:MAG: FtsW/RodA/SpoVE family cell cycle protein [Blastocatellia bacterium]